MRSERQDYEGSRIELREREGRPELVIDNVTVRYNQLPNGLYFLHDYAYDWSDNLLELARKFIDYRLRVDKVRRRRDSQESEKK